MARHVRLVLADRSLSALRVAYDCRRELAARPPGNASPRTLAAVNTMLCEMLRAAGRDRRLAPDRWTAAELSVKERFARAVVAGKYRSARLAAEPCRLALEALSPGKARFVERGAVAVYSRLLARVQELGGSPANVPYSRREHVVVERFARAVLAGRYVTIKSATPDCRREMRGRGGPGGRRHVPERTERAVRLRLQLVVRQMCPDRPTSAQRAWTRQEVAVVDRYVRRVARGFYPTPAAAAADCLRAIARVAPPGHLRRTPEAVRRCLSDRIAALHLPPSGRTWTAAEERLVDRYARMVADGRLKSAVKAAELCAAAVNRLRRRFPGRYRASYVRKPATVHGRMLPRIAALRYPRPRTRWTAPELALVDRYARAVIAHEFPDLLAAARVCITELARIHPQAGGRGGDRVSVRGLMSVRDMLDKRAHELDWRQLPHRYWTAQECAVSARYVRAYARHKQGRATAGIGTLARMMKAELGRLGFYRSTNACEAELIAGLRPVRRRRVRARGAARQSR
ncbi:MAG: hypothetical protein R6X13_00485 [bacterium]